MTCEHCRNFEVCMEEADSLGQVFDPNYYGEHGCASFVLKTNADRIRAMSDEKLAQWLAKLCFCTDSCPASTNEVEESLGYYCPQNCKEQALKWLQQPAEEDENA